jgi:glycosyltransferase involved in cell wall biosynthesis
VRIVVDARPAVYALRTGVGTYARELIRRLPAVDPENEYVAWYVHFRTALRTRRHFGHMALPNLRERGVVYPSRLLERTARLGLPRVEWFGSFDVLLATNFVPPPTRSRAVVATVHDLAFRLFPKTAPHAVAWWREAVDATVRRAARVVVPSEATRADLLRLYDVEQERVVVVPLGVDRDVFRPPAEADVLGVRRRFDLDGDYLVALGRGGRKNLPRLFRALARLPEDLWSTLVVVGGRPWTPDGSDPDVDSLASLPSRVRRAVRFVGYVSDRDAATLLGGATALAYPSTYEGFGLPALEAMACGTPVVASAASSLPEVVGDAAVLVDPTEEASIRDGVAAVLSDAGLRARLREAGLARAATFDWDRTARGVARALHEAGRDPASLH